MISLIILERPLKKNRVKLPNVFPYTNSPLRTTTPTLSRMEVFLLKNVFCKKPTQLDTTQYLDLFVIYREVFNMNSGKKNQILVDEDASFSQQSMSSSLVFDSVKNTFPSTPLNSSCSFGIVHYYAHKNTI